MKLTVDIIEDFISALDLSSDIVSFSDDGTDSVIIVEKTFHARTGMFATIDGTRYKIKSVVFNESITVEGVIAGPALFYSLDSPFYFHGTPIMTNTHISQAQESEKTPMVYLYEILREKNNSENERVRREGEVRFFFLDSANFEDWDTDEHYSNRLKGLNSLVDLFIDTCKENNQFYTFETEFNRTNHVNWGVFIGDKGHTKRIFSDNLTGVELSFNLRLYDCKPSIKQPVRVCLPATAILKNTNALSPILSTTDIKSGETKTIIAPDGSVEIENTEGDQVNFGEVESGGSVAFIAPDGTAIIKDQQGNTLATESVVSGGSKEIIVNANTMFNINAGAFPDTGVIDLSLDNGSQVYRFYNDYEAGNVITSLSVGANPYDGAISYFRILGGLLDADAIPTSWNIKGDAISQDPNFYNKFVVLYANSGDITIVNTLDDAPDLVTPEFTAGPTATNIQATSFDVTATLNENGTVYGYLLPAADPDPDTDTVIANAQDSFVDSGSGGTLSYSGLDAETDYKVHTVAEDTAGNKQATPTVVPVTTASGVTYESIILAKGNTVYDASLIDLGSANVRNDGANDFLINWIDQSPTGNDASQATDANQFQIEDITKSVLPDGVNDFMTSGNIALDSRAGAGYSLYLALDKNNSEDTQIILNNTTNSGYNIFFIKAAGKYDLRINDGTNNLIFSVSGSSNFLGNKIYEVHHDDAGNAELLINGVSVATVTGAAQVLKLFDRIGSRTTGLYYTGKINAIQAYDLLDNSERLLIRQTLASKFGVTL